jgi:hypothetical protein
MNEHDIISNPEGYYMDIYHQKLLPTAEQRKKIKEKRLLYYDYLKDFLWKHKEELPIDLLLFMVSEFEDILRRVKNNQVR